jgi:group II intron reverse transcriptase/maturase
MAEAQTWTTMSPELLQVGSRAKEHPNMRFNSLAHLLDEQALRRAFHRIRKDAAQGVDGITKDQYQQDLQKRLRDLHERMKSQRYRHQPIRRVHIPKTDGKLRPIGISTIEDKVVQGALTEILDMIYEQDFLACSYGYRPGRSAHDALRDLDNMVVREGAVWILEADIKSFFDSLDRTRLREMIQKRVADSTVLKLIGKCLHVGVLDGEQYSRPEEGTAQGSIISPLLGNVYLHYVLDEWFEREVKPGLAGSARLIRYCDDFVIGFSSKRDADEVLQRLGERMTSYGLTLHPDKTRLLPFQRPFGLKGKGPATFDFLGFTLYWRRTQRGRWTLGMKTRKARLRKAVKAIQDWCRDHRHQPLKEQRAALSRRLHGHYNYFGVNGNISSLTRVIRCVERSWFKWLRRRSQRSRLTWERYAQYLRTYPLPAPRIKVSIWSRS